MAETYIRGKTKREHQQPISLVLPARPHFNPLKYLPENTNDGGNSLVLPARPHFNPLKYLPENTNDGGNWDPKPEGQKLNIT